MGTCCSAAADTGNVDARRFSSVGAPEVDEDVPLNGWRAPHETAGPMSSTSHQESKRLNLASITIHHRNHHISHSASAASRLGFELESNSLPLEHPDDEPSERTANFRGVRTTAGSSSNAQLFGSDTAGNQENAAMSTTPSDMDAAARDGEAQRCGRGASSTSYGIHDAMINLPVPMACCGTLSDDHSASTGVNQALRDLSAAVPPLALLSQDRCGCHNNSCSAHSTLRDPTTANSISPPGVTSTTCLSTATQQGAPVSPQLRFSNNSLASHPGVSVSISQPSVARPYIHGSRPPQSQGTVSTPKHTPRPTLSHDGQHSPLVGQRSEVSTSRLSVTMISKVDVSLGTDAVDRSVSTGTNHRNEPELRPMLLEANSPHLQRRSIEPSTSSTGTTTLGNGAPSGGNPLGFLAHDDDDDDESQGDVDDHVPTRMPPTMHHQPSLRVQIHDSVDMDLVTANHQTGGSIATQDDDPLRRSKSSAGLVSPLSAKGHLQYGHSIAYGPTTSSTSISTQLAVPQHPSVARHTSQSSMASGVSTPITPAGLTKAFPKTRTIVQDNRYGTASASSSHASPPPALSPSKHIHEPLRFSEAKNNSPKGSRRGESAQTTKTLTAVSPSLPTGDDVADVGSEEMTHAQIMKLLVGGSCGNSSGAAAPGDSVGHHYESFAPLQMPSHLWPS